MKTKIQKFLEIYEDPAALRETLADFGFELCCLRSSRRHPLTIRMVLEDTTEMVIRLEGGRATHCGNGKYQVEHKFDKNTAYIVFHRNRYSKRTRIQRVQSDSNGKLVFVPIFQKTPR